MNITCTSQETKHIRKIGNSYISKFKSVMSVSRIAHVRDVFEVVIVQCANGRVGYVSYFKLGVVDKNPIGSISSGRHRSRIHTGPRPGDRTHDTCEMCGNRDLLTELVGTRKK